MATASRGATGTDVAGEGFGGDFCPVFGLNLHVHGWQVTNQPGIFPCTLMSVLSRIPFFFGSSARSYQFLSLQGWFSSKTWLNSIF
jgi:hypothetical protein